MHNIHFAAIKRLFLGWALISALVGGGAYWYGLRQISEQAVQLAAKITYPLVVRPSYVLGGRAMEIVYDEQDLRRYFNEAVSVSNESPVLLDRYLDNAIEVDVDAICDGEQVVIGGIMEHIEQCGIHSGDSGCSLPPYTLSADVQDRIREQVRKLAMEDRKSVV